MKTNVFNKPITFLVGAMSVSDLPLTGKPEVCFIGRSNVGKSSLINALTQNNKVARTSKTPGCTQQINFFDVAELFLLVDLPGYGFAKASKQKIKNWNQLIFNYLRGRQQLIRVFLLIDAKVGITRADQESLEYLKEYGISCQIIATKIDKLKAQDKEKQLESIQKEMLKYPNCMITLLTCSSSKNWGIEEIRESILDCVG